MFHRLEGNATLTTKTALVVIIIMVSDVPRQFSLGGGGAASGGNGRLLHFGLYFPEH